VVDVVDVVDGEVVTDDTPGLDVDDEPT